MWYSASVFKVAEHNRQRPEDALWEMQIFLIAASSEKEAKAKAERLGAEQEHEYRNQAGELVSWKFVSVGKVFEIQTDKLDHGTELFSRFLRKAVADKLLTSVDD